MKTLTTLIVIAGLVNHTGAALPSDYQGRPFDDAAYRAEQQRLSGEKTPQRTAFTPVKVLWDGPTATSGEGWVGKGVETTASMVLDPADKEGKKLIHHHNHAGKYTYSTFGWRWAGPQEASVDLRQFDALSFDIKVTGPQKPQQLFFSISETNPAPISLRKYDPQFDDGSWHTITIPLRHFRWSAHRPASDKADVRGCVFMTYHWRNGDYDIHLNRFTCDRGPAQPAAVQEDRTGGDAKPAPRGQEIPGRLECAFYDVGGAGVAYHDTTSINVLSGILNQSKEHQPAKDATPYHWNFRVEEGVDISFTKAPSDLKHNKNKVAPTLSQLYIGATDDGEWCNYTVELKKAGTYKIIGMYGNGTGSLGFSINHKPACVCKFPLTTGGPHRWNKGEVGMITFTEVGQQLLTLHYAKGNNLAYFNFELVEEK